MCHGQPNMKLRRQVLWVKRTSQQLGPVFKRMPWSWSSERPSAMAYGSWRVYQRHCLELAQRIRIFFLSTIYFSFSIDKKRWAIRQRVKPQWSDVHMASPNPPPKFTYGTLKGGIKFNYQIEESLLRIDPPWVFQQTCNYKLKLM